MGRMTRGIVLAAGSSTRMGRAKGLLSAGDRPFIRRILDALAAGGIADRLVVTRPGDRALIVEVEAAAARAVPNPRADEGQLSSLIAGLDAADAPDVDAVLVTLVDVPLVEGSTVCELLRRAAVSSAPILRAVHAGRHGHPVVFKCAVFDALRHADPSLGAKPVFRAFEVENVEVGDPGVVEDIDTPADYERLFGPARAD
jgi:molybdenum cofactor cytidylyltransferase